MTGLGDSCGWPIGIGWVRGEIFALGVIILAKVLGDGRDAERVEVDGCGWLVVTTHPYDEIAAISDGQIDSTLERSLRVVGAFTAVAVSTDDWVEPPYATDLAE